MVETRGEVTKDGGPLALGVAAGLLERVRALVAIPWQALEHWSGPNGSVGLGLLTDSLRSRSALLIENALLRQPVSLRHDDAVTEGVQDAHPPEEAGRELALDVMALVSERAEHHPVGERVHVAEEREGRAIGRGAAPLTELRLPRSHDS